MAINKKLSVIIVNYNSYHVLINCLKTIFQTQYPKQLIEIIIVDNNSNDKSIRQISLLYPSVHLIMNKNNVGFAAANNQGIRSSNGKYVLILNPDTLVSPDVFSKSIEFMDNTPDSGAMTCKVELTSGELDDACHRGFPNPWNAIFQFSGISNIFPYSRILNGYHLGYQNMNKIHEIDSCTGAFMLVRRIAGDKIKWFDEDFFWYGEDIDFCYRLKMDKWKNYYLPSTKIIHFKGVSSGIKKHTRYLSKATKAERIKATCHRFEVMKIFYNKHYKEKYPKLITNLILAAIRIKEMFHLIKIKV